MSVVVKVDDVSKAYQLGQINTGTLTDDIRRWYAKQRGKEDPFLKVGETNDRTVKGSSNVVWSLKDISFEIKQGDSLGIVGRNGAGKSTLLKLLSQITAPTTGTVKIRGRIASLLEVGTGFHPELSGRDNIFLNGAILGMRKAEIKRKFDEIVDFSGVERYIDTPVKRYSSGMYVRLAFAVAAHLESEILIVDEVLAVGDAEFQRKCMGKMNQLGKSTGRTIIFVSHNMVAIKQLCDRCLYLNKGTIAGMGDTHSIISKYLSANTPEIGSDGIIPPGTSLHGTGEARFRKISTHSSKGDRRKEFFFGEKVSLVVELEVLKNIEDISIGLHLLNVYGEKVAMVPQDINYKPISINKGVYVINVNINEVLMPGDYSFALSVSYFYTGSDIDFIETAANFKINKESLDKDLAYPWETIHGYIRPNASWQIKQISE